MRSGAGRPPVIERIEAGGITTHLSRQGSGPPVIVVHGFTGSIGAMAPLAERLVGHHEVLAYDVVGHGGSARPATVDGYRMERAVDQLLGVAAAAPEQPGVVGYSMGGRVALCALAAHPDRFRSVAVIGAHPGFEDSDERAARRQADERLAAAIERHGIEWFVDEWIAQPFFATQRRLGQAHLEAARRRRLQNDPQALANSLRGMGTGAQTPVWDALAAIAMPLRYIAGGDDVRFVAIGRRLVGSMPRASLSVIEGAGHAVHLERPEAAAADLVGFFRAPPA